MTAAQQHLHAVFQSSMDCVAAVCEELEPAFPDVAPHAAHFLRHGASGIVGDAVDAARIEEFRDAFLAAMNKKKYRHMAVLLAGGIADVLQMGVAFATGAQVVNAPPPAADARAPDPLVPMVLIGKARKFKNATAADSADRVTTRQLLRELVFKKVTSAALRALFTTQLAEAPANALPARVIAALENANALYAASVGATAGRRHETWPCALWHFVVNDIAIHDIEYDKASARSQFTSVAVLRVTFDHDGSELLVMLQREIPQLLDEWRRRPAPRDPLHLQYMWPMQTVAASAEQRFFTVTNFACRPVAVAPAQQPAAEAPAGGAAPAP